MRENRLLLAGAIVGVVGTALLVIEAVRAIVLHDTLSSAAQLIMWVGLGVMALGGVLLIAAAWQEAPELRRGAAAGTD